MDNKRVGGGLIGAASSFLGWLPVELHPVALAVAIAMGVDWLTGSAAAALDGKITSSTLRNRWFAKLAQYAGIVGLGCVVATLTGVHAWIGAAGYGVIGVEVVSVVENLNKLQRHGVDLGPLKPFLTAVERFFDKGQTVPGESEEDDGGDSDTEPEGEHRGVREMVPAAATGDGEG